MKEINVRSIQPILCGWYYTRTILLFISNSIFVNSENIRGISRLAVSEPCVVLLATEMISEILINWGQYWGLTSLCWCQTCCSSCRTGPRPPPACGPAVSRSPWDKRGSGPGSHSSRLATAGGWTLPDSSREVGEDGPVRPGRTRAGDSRCPLWSPHPGYSHWRRRLGSVWSRS